MPNHLILRQQHCPKLSSTVLDTLSLANFDNSLHDGFHWNLFFTQVDEKLQLFTSIVILWGQTRDLVAEVWPNNSNALNTLTVRPITGRIRLIRGQTHKKINGLIFYFMFIGILSFKGSRNCSFNVFVLLQHCRDLEFTFGVNCLTHCRPTHISSCITLLYMQ